MIERFFEDRIEAGRRLAHELCDFKQSDTVVLAITRGGVPVGYEVAKTLEADFDVIVPRKLPIPWNPEAGFGAITPEGTIVLNEAMVESLELEEDQIKSIAEDVRLEIERREKLFRGDRKKPELAGKNVIIVDDGIASGYTMLAAIRSVRKRNPNQLIAAAPVASSTSLALIRPEVDKLVVLIESTRLPFAVADFYLNWYDLDDEEVRKYLEE